MDHRNICLVTDVRQDDLIRFKRERASSPSGFPIPPGSKQRGNHCRNDDDQQRKSRERSTANNLS